LQNGEIVVGQCQISHPTSSTEGLSVVDDDWDEDTANRLMENMTFSKDNKSGGETALGAPISEIFYINAYGQEIYPRPNPDYIHSLYERRILVYSCGSLWTSVMPCLALRGLGDAIASSPSLKVKVLLLNSRNDRETMDYDAEDYIRAIANTLSDHVINVPASSSLDAGTVKIPQFPLSAFVTHVVYLMHGEVKVDVRRLQDLGVKCLQMESSQSRFDTAIVHAALEQIIEQMGEGA